MQSQDITNAGIHTLAHCLEMAINGYLETIEELPRMDLKPMAKDRLTAQFERQIEDARTLMHSISNAHSVTIYTQEDDS